MGKSKKRESMSPQERRLRELTPEELHVYFMKASRIAYSLFEDISKMATHQALFKTEAANPGLADAVLLQEARLDFTKCERDAWHKMMFLLGLKYFDFGLCAKSFVFVSDNEAGSEDCVLAALKRESRSLIDAAELSREAASAKAAMDAAADCLTAGAGCECSVVECSVVGCKE